MSSISIKTQPDTLPILVMDPAAVASLLGLTTAVAQQYLEELGPVIEENAAAWVFYREYREIVELPDNTETELDLAIGPISSVTSCLQPGDTESVEEGTDDGEFEILNGHLRRTDCWEAGTWEVEYFAGYWVHSMSGSPPSTASELLTVRPDVRRAVIDTLNLWRVRDEDQGRAVRKEKGLPGHAEIEYVTPSHGFEIPPTALRIFESLP